MDLKKEGVFKRIKNKIKEKINKFLLGMGIQRLLDDLSKDVRRVEHREDVLSKNYLSQTRTLSKLATKIDVLDGKITTKIDVLDRKITTIENFEKVVIDYTNIVDDVKEELNKFYDYNNSIIDKRINGLYEDKEFIKLLNDTINNSISVDRYNFEKKLKIAQLKNGRDLDTVLKNSTKVASIVINNYLISKYLKRNEYGKYILPDITFEDRQRDLNTIYNNFMSVASDDLLSFELSLFFDLSSISTKELVINNIINPVYTPLINMIIAEYKTYLENQEIRGFSYDDTESSINDDEDFRTDIEKKIDELLHR